MPYDGSGNFTIINSFEQDRVNDISIDSAKMDANFNDVAGGLSNAVLRSGASAMAGVLNMANYKIQNLADGTVSSDAVNRGQLDTCVKLSGSQTIADTKTFSSSPVIPTPANNDNSTKAASTAYVKNILSAVYPVGSIYIGTQTTCPLETLISGSTWVLVAADKALWTGNGSNGNTTIAAGLPNITGSFEARIYWGSSPVGITNSQGAFSETNAGAIAAPDGGGDLRGSMPKTFDFNASRSSSIYGNSNTVQPPAYVVNIWRRTA